MAGKLITAAELAEKRDRVLGLLEKHGLHGVVLTTLANVSWFTGGVDLHVARNTTEAVGALVITRDRFLALTNASETPRLRAEEFAESPFEVLERPWYEPLASQVDKVARSLTSSSGPAGEKAGSAGSVRLGCDDRGLAAAIAGAKFVGPEIAALRYLLTPWEVERYREVGRLTGEALEEAAKAVRPGMTEWQVAGILDKALFERELEPTVTLIAADERIREFRHPIPTGNRVERYCMLITCARRYGLIAAATRIVHFGALSGDLRRRHQAVVDVDATAVAASRPGATMGELYEKIAAAYAANGYPGEEQFHHQGGPVGYENREYLAAPGSRAAIQPAQALAWNPSIAGTKSEDTYLVTAGEARDTAKLECLTAGDGSWPAIEVSKGGVALRRPDILVL